MFTLDVKRSLEIFETLKLPMNDIYVQLHDQFLANILGKRNHDKLIKYIKGLYDELACRICMGK